MRRLLLGWLLLLAAGLAAAHPSPKTAVMLHLHGGAIEAEIVMPVVELKLGWDKPFPLNDAALVVRDYGKGLKGYLQDHIHPVAPDGRPWTVTVGELTPVLDPVQDVKALVTLTPPPGAPADRLTLDYDVILHHLVTHEAIVSIASDWRNGLLNDKPVLLGTLWDRSHRLVIDRSSGSWWKGFASVFGLGARHIAEGTDHLLFLLALLLPAPLVAVAGRWRDYAGGRLAFGRILKIVSAFTVGHSVTLVVGALGLAKMDQAPIEAAIALSIFVSAVHALVPVFRGREVLIAGGFGLVHGLSFAAVLMEFGFDPITMASSVLGFNLGIEAVQILVIAVTMPWLVLLARTRLYPAFRVGGALLTGLAAATWFGERALGLHNPVGPVVERIAAHAPWVAAAIAVVAIVASRFPELRVAVPERSLAGT